MIFSAVITEAEEGYVAFNPETGTTSQGETFAEAFANLKEATELFLEEFPLKQKRATVMTSFEIPARLPVSASEWKLPTFDGGGIKVPLENLRDFC